MGNLMRLIARSSAWCGVLLLCSVASLPASADPQPIGTIKILYGDVALVRSGTPQPPRLGQAVFDGDHLETYKDGHIGITFRDNTRISIGPASKLDLTHIVYDPGNRRFGFVVKLFNGTLDYLSGMTEKLLPDSISIQTPTSTIAVRGTHLLVRTQE